MRREVRATANRLANFDDANLRRSAAPPIATAAARGGTCAGDPRRLGARASGCRWVAARRDTGRLEELGSWPTATKDAGGA